MPLSCLELVLEEIPLDMLSELNYAVAAKETSMTRGPRDGSKGMI